MTGRNPLVLVSGLQRELPSGDGLILNGPLNMSNQGITSVANPVSTGDAANKSYVDSSTHTINQLTTSSTALTINKIASGTGDLVDIDDDQGLPLVTVNASGLLTANKSGIVQMADDTTVGLIVKRASTNLNADLQQWQDSTGTVLSFINNNGALSIRSGVVRDAGQFNQAEDTVSNGGSTTPYQMWNPGASVYHFKSYVDRFETGAVRPGTQNPYNSLSDVKFAGRKTTSGIPTSGTWVANDYFVDSNGVPHLCTTGGTPGTWIAGGWSLAGFYKFGSALATSGAVTVAAFDELMIVVRIISMSASTDTPNVRFNADTGSNYRARYISVGTGTSTTLVNTPTANGSSAPLTPILTNLPQVVTVVINNRLGTSKIGVVNTTRGLGSASGTQPEIVLGGNIEWANTTAQITSVELRSSGGSVTFGTDSGFLVLGRNFS